MDIENMDVDTAKRLLKELRKTEDSTTSTPTISFVDRLRLIRRVIVEIESYKDLIIEKPSDLITTDGVASFDGLDLLAGFGGDKGAYTIGVLKQRLKRSPSKAEFLGYVFDDLIGTFSDPNIQQFMAKSEAARLETEQEA